MLIKTHKLNHEEQEKIASIGYFWKTWGPILSAAALAVLLAFAGWHGYQWYQAKQAAKASTLYEQVLADAQSGDADKLAASFKLMQDSYASTAYAQHAGMLAARIFYEQGKSDQSRTALAFVAGQSTDKGLQSAAKLQLAGLMLEQKQYDEAIKLLNSDIDAPYAALAADRLGDAYALQNKAADAIAAYTKAWQGLQANQPYRQMVAVKLGGLGVDITAPPAAPSAAASGVANSAASTATAAAASSK